MLRSAPKIQMHSNRPGKRTELVSARSLRLGALASLALVEFCKTSIPSAITIITRRHLREANPPMRPATATFRHFRPQSPCEQAWQGSCKNPDRIALPTSLRLKELHLLLHLVHASSFEIA
jgi:hypothetical protein